MTQKRTDRPSKLAVWILRRIYPDKGDLTSVGDFQEEYHEFYQSAGSFKANLWYWKQIAKSVPGFIRNKIHWSLIRIHNCVKIAFRNIKRNKGYSLINIAGLAVGMACCLFIIFYVLYEFTYDNFHDDADSIYRVAMEFRAKDQPIKYAATTPPPVAPAILDNFPEVVDAVRITRGSGIVKLGEKHFFENRIFFADPSFFKIFTFPIIKGNPETALEEPYTAVLTESIAEKYFGSEDPVGATISIDYLRDYKITGVVKDVPPNSHFTFDFLFSFAPIEESFQNAPIGRLWFSHRFYTYIKTGSENLSPAFIEGVYNVSADIIGDYEKKVGFAQRFFLQPLKDIYLTSDFRNELGRTGNRTYLFYFMAIAVFILIISSINFVNLSTARSAGRAREVGIRKVAGAAKRQLINQFLGEALFTTFISAGIALLIILISLPHLRVLTGKDIDLHLIHSSVLLCIILIPLVVGLLAGGYPAFILSAYRPMDTLRGAFGHTIKGKRLRKGLVIFQFAVSILLIISTIIVFKQLVFMRNKDLGFNKEQIVVLSLRGSGKAREKYNVLKNEFMKNAAIVSASASYTVPGRNPSSNAMLPEGFSGDQWQTFLINWADYDYLDTYKINLVAGRDFSRDFETDKEGAFILNEEAVKSLGWNSPEDAIGKTWNLGNRRIGQVIGVTKDYHFNSLHQKISPLVIHLDPNYFAYMSLRFTTGSVSETLSFIAETWKELVPDEPLRYFFLNEDLDRQYRAEQKMQVIVSLFTIMGMVIACLGLFGLTSFSVEQRKKEIGIRKVLGSANHKIVYLLVKDFLILVLVANVAALPLGWLFMTKWLQNFAYRTSMSIWIFFLSGFTALAIALLTVSYQSIKTAAANPIDSLRYE